MPKHKNRKRKKKSKQVPNEPISRHSVSHEVQPHIQHISELEPNLMSNKPASRCRGSHEDNHIQSISKLKSTPLLNVSISRHRNLHDDQSNKCKAELNSEPTSNGPTSRNTKSHKDQPAQSISELNPKPMSNESTSRHRNLQAGQPNPCISDPEPIPSGPTPNNTDLHEDRPTQSLSDVEENDWDQYSCRNLELYDGHVKYVEKQNLQLTLVIIRAYIIGLLVIRLIFLLLIYTSSFWNM